MAVEQLIFTDWLRGKGVDPTATGFQIKACSTGLSPEARRLLASICMHHGQAFSASHAPAAAIERERGWLTKTTSRRDVPEEMLDAFPSIWSYDQLADDLFALTRVQYTCLTHDGRTGNFFAHALVFEPDDLVGHGYNPLALSHTDLFRSSDPSAETTLPTLPDLGVPPTVQPRYELLRDAPYRDHLAVMVSSLCTAATSTCPVLLCLADWCQAAPLVEALLGLLPPSIRRRSTFCTYESDRTWMTSIGAGRSAGRAAARYLLVLCGTEDRAFNLRPDEYQSVYAVFNFVGDQFSELGSARRFAAFAAECIVEGHTERLKKYYALGERLDLGGDLDAWDALVPAANLPSQQPSPKALGDAARSLTTLATQPQQAQTALETLAPLARSLAQANDATALEALVNDLAVLTDRVAAGAAEVTPSNPFAAEFQFLAKEAFAHGHGCTTAALLRACGQARDSALLVLLVDALGDSRPPLSSSLSVEDRGQVVDLLLDGLRLAGEAPGVSPPQFSQLLVLTFRVAGEIDQTAVVWEHIGEALVQPRLGGKWDTEKEALAQDIIRYMPADCCPEGSVWLNLRLLEATEPREDKSLAMLIEIARAGSRSAAATDFTENVLRIAQERFSDEHLVVALGHTAEAAHGTGSGDRLFTEYQKVMAQAQPKQRNHAHRRLAEAGVIHVLCHELLGEILPWDEESSKKLQHWGDVVLKSHPRIVDGLCLQVAGMLAGLGQAQGVSPLAKRLVSGRQTESAAGPGLLALYRAVVLALPLEPLSDEWSQSLTPLPDGLAPEVGARLRVLKFMREIGQYSSRPGWSTTEFPHANSIWREDVPSLGLAEKTRVVKWCVGTFKTSGVTTPEEAQGLTQLLSEARAQSPRDVAGVVDWLLRGRDPVTHVLVATAFAQCALETSKPDGRWGKILAAILARFDKNTRRLFELHLAHRFCKRGRKYEARLEQLRVAAGLSRPKPAVAPIRAPEAAEDPTPTSGQLPRVADIWDGFKRRLGRFVGGSEVLERLSNRQEK